MKDTRINRGGDDNIHAQVTFGKDAINWITVNKAKDDSPAVVSIPQMDDMSGADANAMIFALSTAVSLANDFDNLGTALSLSMRNL